MQGMLTWLKRKALIIYEVKEKYFFGWWKAADVMLRRKFEDLLFLSFFPFFFLPISLKLYFGMKNMDSRDETLLESEGTPPSCKIV